MKKLLFALILVSSSAYADCYTVNNQLRCSYNPSNLDVRSGDNSPIIIDKNGQYRGNLNNNPYDPNSVVNPYSQYGSKFSPDSINNPYSPNNY